MGLPKAGAIAGMEFGVVKIPVCDCAQIRDKFKDGACLAIVGVSFRPFIGSRKTDPHRAVKKSLNASSWRNHLMRLEDVEVAGANQGESIKNGREDGCQS